MTDKMLSLEVLFIFTFVFHGSFPSMKNGKGQFYCRIGGRHMFPKSGVENDIALSQRIKSYWTSMVKVNKVSTSESLNVKESA